ncbi:MAG: hypothetical protein AAF618_06750 [Pseudomonadota bacterium]
MNAHASPRPSCAANASEEPDFVWADIEEDGRAASGTAHLVSGSVEASTKPTFLAGSYGPGDLAGCALLREWLISGNFERLTIPDFRDATFYDYRDLALSLMSAAPGLRLIFNAQAPSAPYRRAALRWNDAEDEEPALPGFIPPSTPGRDLTDDLRRAAATLRQPEEPHRVAQRLAHLRKAAAAPARETATPAESDALMLRKGADAANALIPGNPAAPAPGLHLGSGIVLRPASTPPLAESVGSPALGYQITRTGNGAVRHVEGAARLDPAPGKVLKHESMHALLVARDGRVRVAMGALRVAGHTAHHIFATAPQPHLCAAGLFCFNEAWQFVGLTVQAFAPDAVEGLPAQPAALLRATAIWDDLVARADLGCARSADLLRDLGRPFPRGPRLKSGAKSAPENAIGDR